LGSIKVLEGVNKNSSLRVLDFSWNAMATSDKKDEINEVTD